MNTQLIDQIKDIQGVKEVTMVNDMALVVFEPRKPVLHDEYGVPLCDGDEYWWVNVDRTPMEVNHTNLKIKIGVVVMSNAKVFSPPESAQKWIDEQKKPKPIYTDPEDGTEFFEEDVYLYFDKYTCEIVDGTISNLTFKQEDETSSKIYKSRQLCELALAKFIMDKYK